MDKELLRKKYKKVNENASVNNDAYSFLKNYNNIGFYYPIKNELDNKLLLSKLEDKNIYFPYIKNGIFEYHRFNNNLVKDDMNIYSYDGTSIDVCELDIILIPGIAFNKDGYRLGHGNGFYDKALSNYNGIKVGVCHSSKIIKEKFEEKHDIKVDYIFTEKEIIKL